MDGNTIIEDEDLCVQLNNSASTDEDKDTDCKLIKNNCGVSKICTTDTVIKSSRNKCGVMGVENTWNEEENFYRPIAADFPIPLPPPELSFDDLPPSCNMDVVEPGTLDVLFSNSEDHNQENSFLLNNNGDVSDGNKVAGVCGLRNLGNTCFMSTGVQCLVATSSLIRCLLDKHLIEQDNVFSSDSLTSQLAMLMNKMWSGNFSSVHPADFKHSLGTHYPQFKDYRQHDCQEFLALLLDGLHEQMNCANSKLSTLVSNNNSVENSNDILDTANRDSIKQKLDCGNSLQCNECWSPEKGVVNSNNHNYNNNTSCNKIGIKELNEDTDSVFKLVPPSSLSQSTLQITLNKNSDDELCSENVFTVNNNTLSSVSKKISCEQDTPPMSGNIVVNGEGSGLQNNNSDNTQWSCLTDIQNIFKDAKTSNVNVLVTEQENNNEIRFDSDKYPKSENQLRRKETLNFNAFHIYDNNTTNNNASSGKRVKTTVKHYNCVSDFREGLDLKRIKMHRLDYDDFEKDKNQLMEYKNIQSKTLDINLVEKNLRIECKRKLELDAVHPGEGIDSNDGAAGASGGGFCIGSNTHIVKNHSDMSIDMSLNDNDDSSEGQTHWEKHLAANQSIIVDTFQGQFKSTVVCSACKYVSVTYEPFMYLSVPLPHAMERQIRVTFVPSDNSCSSIQYLTTLNKRDKISELKELLIQHLGNKEIKHSSIILAEVFDNHIAKILNDNNLVRYVDDTNRKIYAFELSSFMISSVSNDKVDGQEEDSNIIDNTTKAFGNEGEIETVSDDMEVSNTEDLNKTSIYSVDEDQQITVNKTCTICLEEKESDLQRHFGCNCVMCDGCIVTSVQHYGPNSLICPVCREKVNPVTDLVPVGDGVLSFPVVRMLLVPIVYRIDMLGDGNNNKKTVKLFGHPNVIRLGNNICSQELYQVMAKVVPYSLPYKILLVDGQGRHCSRCMFNDHCRGCPVNSKGDGSLNLTTGDTLAVTFTEPVEEPLVEIHSSMSDLRSQHPLSLYDCIQAFSQSEVLDKQNPWYCPKCQQNQCATKTLTVWRSPDYLIVYLKRFVFQGGISTKLEDKVMFPFHGLNLMTSISYTAIYDLYACVCHIGGVSAGHYTAYTQHPKTEEWHYYNDDIVASQMPQEEDYSNAYILFYKKRGLAAEVSNVDMNDGGEGCSSYNTM